MEGTKLTTSIREQLTTYTVPLASLFSDGRRQQCISDMLTGLVSSGHVHLTAVLTATVDCGHGSPIRIKLFIHRHHYSLAYQYKAKGTYTMTITLRDAQGAEKVVQQQVRIG